MGLPIVSQSDTSLTLDDLRRIAKYSDVIIRKRHVYARLAFRKLARRRSLLEIPLKRRGRFLHKGYLAMSVGTNAANVAIQEGNHS